MFRVLVFQFFTGARISEGCGLTWDRVDLGGERPTVLIDRTLLEAVDGKPQRLGTTTKGKESRRVLLLPPVVNLLLTIRNGLDAVDPDAPIFASQRGTFLTASNLRTRLRALVKGTPLEGVHTHDLRRTYLDRAAGEHGTAAAAEFGGHDERVSKKFYLVVDEVPVLDPTAFMPSTLPPAMTEVADHGGPAVPGKRSR